MTEKASAETGAAPRGLFGRAGRAGRSTTPIETPPRPRTINGALIAVGLTVACTVLGALTWFAFKDQFIHLLIDANNKSKNKDPNYDTAKATSDLNNIRKGQLIQAGVVGLALVFLAYALTRARSASAGRWGLIIVLVLTGNGLIPIKGLPGLANTLRGFGLMAGVTVIGLLFVKSSRGYFAACRLAVTGGDVTARPVGFRGLFSNGMPSRRQPVAKSAPPTTTEASDEAAAVASARPAGSKSRTKARNEQAAVARGAELARTRAKAASKSRRTEN